MSGASRRRRPRCLSSAWRRWRRGGANSVSSSSALKGQGGYNSALMDLAPDLRVLTYQYGFGEIFFRPGLDLKSRVVCTTAALTALRADGQLRNFLRAGPRVGFSNEEIVEVLIQTGGYAGYPAALNAISIAAEVWS